MDKRSAIAKINKVGVLLVFPVKNSKEPDSLWAQFFPRKKMEWEWNEGSDNKVADMWHLMKRLSDCGDVIYSKWYQGRATFFSIDLFTALLRLRPQKVLSAHAQTILEVLEMDSPLSTRVLKDRAGLQGKFNEANYTRAMKELFSQFFIVGYGEVDDGAFPSLAVGATRSLYEAVWNKSQTLKESDAQKTVEALISTESKFGRFLQRQWR